MSKFEQQHYKDVTPEKTVDKLCRILHDCGIEITENWMKESSINTHSLRVTISGTEIGTNGKGVSRAYARASAYAEFFERFQNGVLCQYLEKGYTAFSIANDEKEMTIEELLENNNPFLDYYFRIRNLQSASKSNKALAYRKVNPTDSNDRYVALPFYDVKSNKTIYLPFFTYIAIYGSNGMCAGNSPEEAIVQGLSEIFERVAQKRILIEKPSLPSIPDDFVKRYPYVYEMYQKARSNTRFNVSLLDCSFGGEYPVAALLVIEKNTGRYGLKLGCHPDMGIAMERTFTEICQGYDIFEYSVSRSWLDFSNNNVDSQQNVMNSYKTGYAQYPFELFSNKPTYEFTEMADVSQLSNAELAKKWISSIAENHDVLIRNVSYTGFPSFHIIIPGVSELADITDYDLRMQNTRAYVCKLLKEPRLIENDDLKYITATLRVYSRSVLENTLDAYYPKDAVLNLPFSEISADMYLMAMCYVAQQDFVKAKESLLLMCNRAKELDINEKIKSRLTAIYYYVSGRVVFDTHYEVIDYLRSFLDEEMLQYIDNLFENVQNAVVDQYSNAIVERTPYLKDFMSKLSAKYGDVQVDQASVANLFA